MFTENELKMIKFALSQLHDTDLSGLKKEGHVFKRHLRKEYSLWQTLHTNTVSTQIQSRLHFSSAPSAAAEKPGT